MRINFRQGVVSHQSGGFLFFNPQGNVNILAGQRAVTVTVAEKSSNYTFTEDRDVSNAWIGPFANGTSYWLYWDFDTQTFARSFKHTDVEPIESALRPTSPVDGQIWFDTVNNEMSRFNGTGWLKIIAVVAGVLFNGTFTSYSIDAPLFTGTQIGNTSSVRTGRPIFTSAGRTIRKADNTFFTTEDEIFINDSQSAAIRLESSVLRAKNTESAMAAFQIVALSGPGEIRTAQYADSQSTITAVLMESLVANQVGVIVPQGSVTNPAWNFTDPVGTELWIENGALTGVDPHVTNSIVNQVPKTPVARIIAPDTILFEQGLGGVGPRGPKGAVSGQTPASTTELGAVALSTAPSIPGAPVVITDTDPRIAGGPFAPEVHTHPASNITFTPSGNITATNVQAAILQSGGNAAQTTGATFTGPLVLSGTPTAPLQAATKQYVDSQTAGKADSIHGHAAGQITLSPVGNVQATDVQAGIAELDAEKFDKTGGTVTGNITVTGTSSFIDTADFVLGLTTQDDVSITGQLSVSQLATLSANVSVGGDVDIAGNTDVGGTFNTDGVATFGNDVTLSGDVGVVGNLNVGGTTTTNGNFNITGNLNVTADTTLGGTLNITGATTLGADPANPLEAATKQYVDNQVSGTTLTSLPYDMTFFIAGLAATVANQIVGLIVSPREVTIKANATNLYGRALVAPQAVVVYELVSGNAVVGTITFDPAVNSGLVPTYSIPTDVSVSAGGYLQVRPTTQETNISDVGVTIIACSTELTCPI